MPDMKNLDAIYNQMDFLLTTLDKAKPLDAKIGQDANDLNLALREVQKAVPSSIASGMRELMEQDSVTELISRAAALKAILFSHFS